MTTPAAAACYLAAHQAELSGRKNAVYNPHNKPEEELPHIYGFNNGGPPEWLTGVLIAEDGTVLGSHICSHEGYMYYDLGILEGTRPDRHEGFRKHYVDGYRILFVTNPREHEGLLAAISKCRKRQESNDEIQNNSHSNSQSSDKLD